MAKPLYWDRGNYTNNTANPVPRATRVLTTIAPQNTLTRTRFTAAVTMPSQPLSNPVKPILVGFGIYVCPAGAPFNIYPFTDPSNDAWVSLRFVSMETSWFFVGTSPIISTIGPRGSTGPEDVDSRAQRKAPVDGLQVRVSWEGDDYAIAQGWDTWVSIAWTLGILID